MKRFLISLLALGLSFSAPAQLIRSWDGIQDNGVKEMEHDFAVPPAEYASHILWGWEGAMDAKIMKSDLDLMQSVGTRVINIEPGYDFPYEYLSEGWWKMIKLAVKEAKSRGMKVWLIDDAKYPSGFAGGKFSRERPDLKMWALVKLDETVEVKAGKNDTIQVPAGAVSAIATAVGQPNRELEIKDGKVVLNAGIHDWTVLFAGYAHKSGDTRAVNLANRGKDTTNFLHDHLNPEAVDQFIAWTHEAAKKALGKEMGTTVMGFRGDEPEYMYTPWTPKIIETFIEKKGYDPTPYFASFFAPTRTEMEKRVKADYWDVWSEMFADNFFKRQADWHDANGVAHITHLNNEHIMPVNIDANGSFFRVLNRVQIPGVDVISGHVSIGTDNDFPKLASSVAHVYGRPRAFSETMGAISNSEEATRQVLGYQFVRGINYFEYNFWSSKSQTAERLAQKPHFKKFADYINRTSYMLSQGVPGARVAMYYPTLSMWLDNNAVYWNLSNLSQMLMRHQVDFDYIEDDGFFEALTVGPGYLENKSGQKYYTLIIPPTDVISKKAWAVIDEFVKMGGKLLFWGSRPNYLVDKTFTQMESFPDYPQAVYEPWERWTAQVESVMPEPEFRIIAERPTGTYMSGPKAAYMTEPRRSQAGPGPQGMGPAPQGAMPQGGMPQGGPAPGMQPQQQRKASDSQAWVTIESFKRRMGMTEVIIPTDSIRYTRRILKDGDLFYIFNEGGREQTFTAELDAAGRVSEWDAFTGTVKEIPFEAIDGKTRVTLTLEGYGAKIITVSKDSKEFNVKDFGAKGNGREPDTKAIQAAADAAYANGGGVVVIPEGEYLSGALFFKNGVDLNIQKGATLVSTVDSDDFPQISTRFEGVETMFRCAFLNFDDSRNVHVWGEGKINGRGQEWAKNKNKDGHWGRPRMLCFTNCPGGKIEGLTMVDHASWCLHVLYTDGFTIDGVNISVSSYVPSSDGVDIDSSSNIEMRNVYTNVTDDCLSIKSGKNEDGRRVGRPSMNIHVENCNFDGGHGVAMGSEISGCIRHVVIENCVCGEKNNAPVRFKSQPSRGGLVEDITFKDFELKNCGTFIDANMIWRMVEDYPEYDPRTELRDIKVIGLKGSVRSVGSIYGDPAAPIKEGTFTFKDCVIDAQRGLYLANVDQENFDGLTINVPEGLKPIKKIQVSYGGRSSGQIINPDPEDMPQRPAGGPGMGPQGAGPRPGGPMGGPEGQGGPQRGSEQK